jgi:hypothetical protein
MRIRAALLCGIFALPGCAGAGTTPPAPQGIDAAMRIAAAAGGTTRVVLQIVVPSKMPHRRSRYVSPSTQSLVYDVTLAGAPVAGGAGYANLTPASPACTSTPLTCTIVVPLELAGTDVYTFALATYDAAQSGPAGVAPCVPPSTQGCAGHLLSQTIAPEKLVAGALNRVALTLGGVPAAVAVTPVSPGYLRGGGTDGFVLDLWGPQTQQVSVQALDAAGNLIVGPGAPTLSLISGAAKLQVTPTGSAGLFTIRAATSGDPPLVATGDVPLSAFAVPVADSGTSEVRSKGIVRVRHSILYVTTEVGALQGFYDGNLRPTTSLQFEPPLNFSRVTLSGVAVQVTGDVYVAAQVAVFGIVAFSSEVWRCPQGATLQTQCQSVSSLNAVGLASDASVFYVSDEPGNVFACGADCSLRTKFAKNDAAGLALDAARTLYIANPQANTVTSCPLGTAACGTFAGVENAWGDAVDSSGTVYVSSRNKNRVYACTSSSCAEIRGSFMAPEGLAIDAATTLYVANSDCHSVEACQANHRCRRLLDIPEKPHFIGVVPPSVQF